MNLEDSSLSDLESLNPTRRRDVCYYDNAITTWVRFPLDKSLRDDLVAYNCDTCLQERLYALRTEEAE